MARRTANCGAGWRGGVLGKRSLLRLLQANPPLVEGLISLEEQLQPNGIDLTVGQVAMLGSQGWLGVGSQERRLSTPSPLVFDGLGFLELPAGCYLVTYNETVHLPSDVAALGRPRSTLLRCGVALHTAVWDAGYSGRSQSLMVVYNPYGFRLARNARIMQLVSFLLTETTEGYQGVYQGENI